MSDPRTLLCPGQGAQSVGMGSVWREASPAARAIFERSDEILGDTLPAPLTELCANGPDDLLNRTDIAQPAIFVCSVASWHGLLESWQMTPTDVPLSASAGLSLGEYTALHLSGVISFEETLQLVILRGRAMQDAAEANPSSMLALIGADEDQARKVCESARGQDVLVCANFNAPGQIVLSGSTAACERAGRVAREMGLRAALLPVAGAFHSPIMQPAADRLREALDRTALHTPRCPVLANVTGQPHTHNPEDIRRRLVEQLTWPVRWSACCQWINEHIDAAQHELAPGRTLSGLMRRIDRSRKVTTHDSPD